MVIYWTEYKDPPDVQWSKPVRHKDGTCRYAEISAAFDTETSSWRDDRGDVYGTMYVWQFGIGDKVYYGRTWDEFLSLYVKICISLKLGRGRRLLVYVHNLEFDFQFLRKHLTWNTVFSMSDHKPLYAVSADGLEFRDSYLLAGCSLATVGKNLKRHTVRKMEGDLDYDLIRHCKTPLTNKELEYMEHDILVLLAYIDEYRDEVESISRIPYTKTGKVRGYCRACCLPNPKDNRRQFWEYHRMIFNLTLEPQDYTQMKDAFQGGFVHGSAYHVGRVLRDVTSWDLCSSYPAVLVAEMFPMSRPVPYTPKDAEDLRRCFRQYCCIFDVELFDVLPRPEADFEHILSFSKCRDWDGYPRSLDNGRVISIGHCRITCTETDYLMLEKFYTWDRSRSRIYNFKIMTKTYLPHAFVNAILSLYADKTTLKGVEGKEIEYQVAKEMLNAVYGCCVTDICRTEWKYNSEEWKPVEPDIKQELEEYNTKWNRFLYYAWGVWCTSYARRNVYSAIMECKGDYVYSDTDSVKILHGERHIAWFKRYNANMQEKLKAACRYHAIPFHMVKPHTVKGDFKLLGAFECEGTYETFKTQGAKRYLYVQDGEMHMTVAGLNKKIALPWLERRYAGKSREETYNNIYEAFTHAMTIPAEGTGKKTHFYLDEPTSGRITDYLGQEADWMEYSSIALIPTTFTMSMAAEYLKYIMRITVKEFL